MIPNRLRQEFLQQREQYDERSEIVVHPPIFVLGQTLD
jgi:hypothetical protein